MPFIILDQNLPSKAETELVFGFFFFFFFPFYDISRERGSEGQNKNRGPEEREEQSLKKREMTKKDAFRRVGTHKYHTFGSVAFSYGFTLRFLGYYVYVID